MSLLKGNLEGLVFAMPLAEGRYSFGQVIKKQSPIYYMVGFDFEGDSKEIDKCIIENANIVVMGNFFDVLIKKGHWTPMFRMPVRPVPFPCFKIKVGDDLFVENWSRSNLRKATDHELPLLQFRSNHGPIILENAIKHYFGLRKKEEVFDYLSKDYIEQVCDLV